MAWRPCERRCGRWWAMLKPQPRCCGRCLHPVLQVCGGSTLLAWDMRTHVLLTHAYCASIAARRVVILGRQGGPSIRCRLVCAVSQAARATFLGGMRDSNLQAYCIRCVPKLNMGWAVCLVVPLVAYPNAGRDWLCVSSPSRETCGGCGAGACADEAFLPAQARAASTATAADSGA